MRTLLTIIAVVFALQMLGCERSVSVPTLEQTATQIFNGTIETGANGTCTVDAKNNVVDDVAYVTLLPDGSKLVLFRTWQGKGSNLRGILHTNGPALTVGSEIEVLTFQPTGLNGGLPIGRADVSIDSEIKKSWYRVSRSLD